MKEFIVRQWVAGWCTIVVRGNSYKEAMETEPISEEFQAITHGDNELVEEINLEDI